MTKHKIFVSVMFLVISSLNILAADIRPHQKSAQSISSSPAPASNAAKMKDLLPPKRVQSVLSVDKSTTDISHARKTKRRSKQVIIVIVVDDQESSWI